MRRIVFALIVALSGAVVQAQTVPTQGLPARFIAAFPGAGVETSAILGAFVKSITPDGVATVQLADETETTVTLTASGGGATITSGTADPTGGDAGDAYLQVDASSVVQSIWLNVMSTWTEYTIPSGGTSTDDQTAAEVDTDTSNFGGNLGGTDTTVQTALDTIDDLTIPDEPAPWALATGATGTAPPERLPGYTIHRESSSQTYDPTNGVIAFAVDGTLRNGDFIVFDAPSNLGSDDSVNLTVNVNNTGNRNLIDREENRINETHLEASAWYIVQRDSSSYSVLTNLEDVPTQEQIEDHVGALINRGTKTGITVTYTDNADNAGQIDFNVTGGGGGGGGSAGEILVDDLSVDWDLENGPSPAIQLSRVLTDDDDLGLVYLDWREWPTTDPGEPYRDAGLGITVSAIRGITNLASPVAVNKTPNSAGNPIDQSVAVADNRIFGSITLRFPRSTQGGGHSDMRMVYIGDHLTDTNENLDQTETDITVVSSASLVAGRDYWLAGPLQGCATTFPWGKDHGRLGR